MSVLLVVAFVTTGLSEQVWGLKSGVVRIMALVTVVLFATVLVVGFCAMWRQRRR